MTHEQIKDKISSIINLMGIEVVPSFDARLNTFIDSLEVVELVIEVERIFEIGIINEEIESLVNLNHLVALIELRLSGSSVPFQPLA